MQREYFFLFQADHGWLIAKDINNTRVARRARQAEAACRPFPIVFWLAAPGALFPL